MARISNPKSVQNRKNEELARTMRLKMCAILKTSSWHGRITRSSTSNTLR